MKNIKFIFGFLFLLTISLSCSVEGIDEDTSFVNSVKAPSNVAAFYNITQDNTGLVTITPSGEGAVSYQIYYGDTTTTPVTVMQGKKTTHIYKEGTYTVKIVATGITGLKTEATQSLIVSFKAPENLVVVITNDNAISKKVNVTANADYATMFDVYFGEPGKDDPVSANIGEIASYIFQQAGTYKIKVVAKSAAIKTTNYEVDFIVTAIMAPTASAPTQPTRVAGDVISIFSSKYTDLTGTDFFPYWWQSTIYAEYNLNGDKILKYSNLNYQGIDLASNINATNMEYLHIDVWSAYNMPLDIYPLPNGVTTNDERFVTKNLIANQWNSFNIPLTEFTSQGLPLSSIKQFKFVSSSSGKTIFIDNLYFYKNPTPMVLPINFESTVLNYNWIGFGNSGFGAIPTEVVANPDKRGSNTTNKVLKITKTAGSQTWAGASQELDSKINFSAGTTIKVAVWSPLANSPILLKLEHTETDFVEVKVSTTTSNAWEILTFNLTAPTGGNFDTSKSYKKFVLFPNFGTSNSTDLIYYFDEIIQSN